MHYINNIKFRTSLTFILLVVIAMLLTNITVTMIWYRSLVKSTLEDVKASFEVLQAEKIGLDENSVENKLPKLMKLIGAGCRQLIFISDGFTYSLGGSEQNVRIMKEKLSLSSHKEGVLVTLDRTDPPLPFIPKLYLSIHESHRDNMNVYLGALIDPAHLQIHLMKKQKFILVYLIINTVVLAAIFFFRMRKSVFKPIDRLVAVADSYRVTNGVFILEQSENEIGKLGNAMTRMVNRIEADRTKLKNNLAELELTNKQLLLSQQEVLQAERLATAGRLSSGIAHEIGNPLAIIKGYMELLNDDLSEDDRRSYVDRCISEINRIDLLIQQLLDTSRIEKGENKNIVLSGLIQDILDSLYPSYSSKNIKIDCRVGKKDKGISVWGAENLLRQAFVNCLMNSIDSVYEQFGGENGGEIICEVRRSSMESDVENVVVEICDNGKGVAEKDIDMIFEPFFTTKEPGEGTGLGLAICSRILESMKGDISVESVPQKGATFRVNLPVSKQGVSSDI